MGFKAEGAVPALEYDFRPHVEAHGTTPEPSNDEMVRFLTRFYRIVESAKRSAISQTDKAREKSKNRTEEELDALRDRWASASWSESLALLDQELGAVEVSDDMVREIAQEIERLSKGSPTADQVLQLPGRIRAAYVGWLVGQLSNPEASAADTTPSLGVSLGGVPGI